jgi:MoxR-like ATPase
MRSDKNTDNKKKSAVAKNGHVISPDNYRPSDKEPFMNERQREYFRSKLLAWKDDILKEAKETLAHLQAENENHPDLADRASSETDRAIELRARDRQRKLIAQDQRGAGTARRGHLRILRGDRRADRAQAA